MLSINLPCEVESHQKVGNFKLASFPVSRRQIIFPPSILFLARRSGCQERIESASPFSMHFIISLNTGRPGTLADCFSTNSRAMFRFSLLANSRNSVSCASILKTCLSSTSVDLRAYKKNFLFSILLFIVIKILFVFRAKQIHSQNCILISHLLLCEKTSRPAEGGNPNSFGKMGGNQWDALRASHLLALKKPLSSVLVSLLYQARTYFQNK